MASTSLPSTQKALVQLDYAGPLQVKEVPVPQPTPGSAIVKVLSAHITSYLGDIYNGTRKYPYATPLVTGTACIGRVVVTGADAIKLEPGNLVRFDIVIRGRDDPSSAMLAGILQGNTPSAAKLMQGEWRDATFAEYAKLPLENLFVLNEKLLLGSPQDGGLGYTVEELMYTSYLLIPAGGLTDIDLKPGETIIVAPATGAFGGAAVHFALAMGAKVIAMGRNKDALQKIGSMSERIRTVAITGDVDADAASLKQHGLADAYFDISPPEATNSSHFKSAIYALRHGGRISIMSGTQGDIGLPLAHMMYNDMTLKGKWMYSRDTIHYVDKLIEAGNLKLGKAAGFPKPAAFKLEDSEAAFKHASEHFLLGDATLFNPQSVS